MIVDVTTMHDKVVGIARRSFVCNPTRQATCLFGDMQQQQQQHKRLWDNRIINNTYSHLVWEWATWIIHRARWKNRIGVVGRRWRPRNGSILPWRSTQRGASPSQSCKRLFACSNSNFVPSKGCFVRGGGRPWRVAGLTANAWLCGVEDTLRFLCVLVSRSLAFKKLCRQRKIHLNTWKCRGGHFVDTFEVELASRDSPEH